MLVATKPMLATTSTTSTEIRCGFNHNGWLSRETGACCAESCLKCDDSPSCSTRTGGAHKCCATMIMANPTRVCDSKTPPPCFTAVRVTDTQVSPKTAVKDFCIDEGIISTDGRVCCAASCGSCEQEDCAAKTGGSMFCCPTTIAKLNMQCKVDNTPQCTLKQ